MKYFVTMIEMYGQKSIWLFACLVSKQDALGFKLFKQNCFWKISNHKKENKLGKLRLPTGSGYATQKLLNMHLLQNLKSHLLVKMDLRIHVSMSSRLIKGTCFNIRITSSQLLEAIKVMNCLHSLTFYLNSRSFATLFSKY